MKLYLGLKDNIINFINNLFVYLFPNFFESKPPCKNEMDDNDKKLKTLKRELQIILEYIIDDENQIREDIETYFSNISQIKDLIMLDVKAGFDGDPAATSLDEVILCYPAFTAISIYRLAHPLYDMNIKIIPRIMTEYAHERTGIDIHPGATIGKSFFIDHGTGVVIGETTKIGDNVKLYQGVTLGALSTKGGQKLRGQQRHPTIGNNVTIYGNATILGGDTKIFDNETVKGNSFITSTPTVKN